MVIYEKLHHIPKQLLNRKKTKFQTLSSICHILSMLVVMVYWDQMPLRTSVECVMVMVHPVRQSLDISEDLCLKDVSDIPDLGVIHYCQPFSKVYKEYTSGEGVYQHFYGTLLYLNV